MPLMANLDITHLFYFPHTLLSSPHSFSFSPFPANFLHFPPLSQAGALWDTYRQFEQAVLSSMQVWDTAWYWVPLLYIWALFMGSHFNITCVLSLSKCSRMILGTTLSDHKCKYPSHIPMLQTVVGSVMTWNETLRGQTIFSTFWCLAHRSLTHLCQQAVLNYL